MSKIK